MHTKKRWTDSFIVNSGRLSSPDGENNEVDGIESLGKATDWTQQFVEQSKKIESKEENEEEAKNELMKQLSSKIGDYDRRGIETGQQYGVQL